jgi:ATP-dependent exoDNAse (exonuclease V) beta subunit
LLETFPEFKDAQIMTVLEAKGLEYNDVFVFNFFTDSTASVPAWKELIDAQLPEGTGTFDVRKHMMLCEELKHLYVAITRAKHRVFLFDSDADKRRPMYRFMQERQLVVADWHYDLQEGGLALKSHASEWANKGDGLVQNEQYEAAAVCFARAYLEEPVEVYKWKEQYATACFLQKQASTEPSPSLRAHHLLSAGYLFVSSNHGEKAAECLLQASKKGAELAARVLLKHQRIGEASSALQVLGPLDRQQVLDKITAEHPEMRQMLLTEGLMQTV